jgi:hypothetical protein
MKRIIPFLLLLFVVASAQAQRKKEFQIRAGFGFAAYATTNEVIFTAFNPDLVFQDEDGTGTLHMPLEIRYELSRRFNAGLDMKFGSYLYDPDSAEGKSNSFFVIGIGLEYNFISSDNFRWYGGLGFNTATLELKESLDYFGTPVERTYRYAGGGFKLNSGVLWFFTGTLGLNANLGYDSHNFELKEGEDNGQAWDLSQVDATLDVGGVDFTLGLAVRF